jgi:glucose-1-phosphate adenylyltransferase
MRYLPASRISSASLHHCLISDGCVIQPGAQIEHSVVGVRARIGRNAIIRDSVLIGADRYETEMERARNRAEGIPDLILGNGCVIEKAIVDKDCRIGHNVRIINRRNISEAEEENYVIREGIVVIPRGTVLRDGTEI